MTALMRRLVGRVTSAGRGLIVLALLGWALVRSTGLTEIRILVVMALLCLGFGLLVTLYPDRGEATLRVRPARTSVGLSSAVELVVRNVGRWPMWSPSVDLRTPDGARSVGLPTLRRGHEHTHRLVLDATRRGVHELGPVTSRRLDPLGLFRRETVWARPIDWYVRPRVVPVEAFAIGTVADLEGVPSDQISMSDLSFHALREYARGDDLRHVHWRSSAKADTLLVRQYHDTRRSHATVVVDADPAAYADPEDFELALSAAASLMLRAAAEDFEMTLVCGSLEVSGDTAEAALDATCRARLQPGDLGDASVHASRLAPETGVLMICTGTAGQDVAVQEAAARFGGDVRRIVLRCHDGADTSLRSTGSLGLAVLGDLDHLPELISRLGAQR